jgi:hypothetical protein
MNSANDWGRHTRRNGGRFIGTAQGHRRCLHAGRTEGQQGAANALQEAGALAAQILGEAKWWQRVSTP